MSDHAKASRELWTVLLTLVVAAFAYLVWPTMWSEHIVTVGPGNTTTMRKHRFTGRSEVLSPDGRWVDQESKRRKQVAEDFACLDVALDLYTHDTGSFPTTEQGLDALWQKPTSPPVPEKTWTGPYLKYPPRDPWGNPYYYRYPGETNQGGYDLACHGGDGRSGGEGQDADIVHKPQDSHEE
jgi:type II secretion system protein G